MNLLYWEQQAREKIASYEQLMRALNAEIEGDQDAAIQILEGVNNIEEVYFHIGRINNNSGKYLEAIADFRRVIRHGELLIIQSLKEEALCYRKSGDLKTAKELLLDALRRAEAIDDPLHVGISLDQLAVIYRLGMPLKDPNDDAETLYTKQIAVLDYAIETHQLAISILRKTDQAWAQGEAYNHLGATILNKANVRNKAKKPAGKEYEFAEWAFRQSLRSTKGDLFAKSTIYIQLVRLHIYRSDWKSAGIFLDKAKTLENKLNREAPTANLLVLEAQYRANTDDLEGAIKSAYEARAIFKKLGNKGMMVKIDQYLAAINTMQK